MKRYYFSLDGGGHGEGPTRIIHSHEKSAFDYLDKGFFDEDEVMAEINRLKKACKDWYNLGVIDGSIEE